MANKKKPFYTKKTLLLFRLFALIAIVILITSFIYSIIYKNLFSSYSNTIFYFTNIISIFLLFFVLIYPQKIEICSIITFIYSLQIFIFEPNNTMGLFMYILTVAMLYARGFYNIHKKQKNIFTIIIFILLNLSQMRFGSKIFLDSLIQTVGFSFIYLLSIYFIKAAIRNDYNTNSSSNILNLKHYDKLTIRDALWLIQIQNKVKYDAIAIKSKVSPGTVKNRLKFIFSVLEVGDKQGFINEYSTFEICYGEYSSEQISSMTFTDDGFIE
ncbi:MAG: hypothetical protein SO161_00945 [Treponema sp.]|nr:hypothetical protein [Treponema sp.]